MYRQNPPFRLLRSPFMHSILFISVKNAILLGVIAAYRLKSVATTVQIVSSKCRVLVFERKRIGERRMAGFHFGAKLTLLPLDALEIASSARIAAILYQ